MNPDRITYFAETDARSKRVPFGIKSKDRTRHVYVIGKTGMGKSTLLENMAVQDIKNGEGMAFIDPHGKTAELLLEYIPPERMKDVLYFAPFDTEYPISFNVLESVDPDKRHLVVSGLMSTFKKIWQDAWSARMEYILTNTLLALLEYPGATLLGVNRMLAEKDFRKDVVDHVTDVSVKNFWVKEFANYTERMAAEAVPAIQNKIGQFTANALIRNMIGQSQSSFNIREMMDNRKILIINLSKGKIGESNANLLGGMLITKIYLAAMSRADLSNRVMATMPNFYLFVDEFQSFANESFADILSEARKYHLNLTIAHQYIEQMEEEVRAAVFGNVGTMIIFRVGAYDAEVLEKEFAPTFTAEDIVNLGQYQIYLKLMIDGISSQPFSATNLPPIKPPEVDHVAEVIAASREQFAHKRADVENDINDWHKPIVKGPPPQSANVAASHASPASSQSSHSYQAPKTAPSMPPANHSMPPVSHQTQAPAHAPAQSQPHFQTQPQQYRSTSPQTSSASVNSTPRFSPTPTAPSPGYTAPRQQSNFQAPRPQPQPHHDYRPAEKPPLKQPFKEAFQKVIPPTAAPISSPSPVPTPTTTAIPQPVSLNTLTKSPVKNDQKTPTSKNVNDLKNALASILTSAKPKEKTETLKEVPKTETQQTVQVPPTISRQKDIPEIKSEPLIMPKKEVPKDILEKILNVN